MRKCDVIVLVLFVVAVFVLATGEYTALLVVGDFSKPPMWLTTSRLVGTLLLIVICPYYLYHREWFLDESAEQEQV